jgi:hypothetical protein
VADGCLIIAAVSWVLRKMCIDGTHKFEEEIDESYQLILIMNN